jgi:predicted N-acetyltransferase YhbS
MTPTIRAATWADREALADMLGVAFSWPSPPSIDFRVTDPHLLCERRVGDHLLALDGQQIIGATGVYGYDLRIDGVALRGAAVGQVATLPERRNKGVMRSLLQAAIRQIHEQDYQLSWLSGDRRRYGAHGWALGGVNLYYEFSRRTLPEPADPSQVESMWPDEIVETIVAHREQLASTALMPVDELALLVKARRPIGLRCGDAWLIHDLLGNEIHFAGGPTHALARLTAHVLCATGKDQLGAVCAHEVSDLSRLGQQCANSYRVVPPCLWRISTLGRTLAAAAEMASARLGPGSDSLALLDNDTGERATLTCADGLATVTPGGERALAFDTRRLSELCFGVDALDHLVPNLRRNSPIRQVLPIRAYHSPFLRF